MRICIFIVFLLLLQPALGQNNPEFCYSQLNICVNSCPGKGSSPGTVKGDEESQKAFFACQKECYRQQDICNGKLSKVKPQESLKKSTNKRKTFIGKPQPTQSDEPQKRLVYFEGWTKYTWAVDDQGKQKGHPIKCAYPSEVEKIYGVGNEGMFHLYPLNIETKKLGHQLGHCAIQKNRLHSQNKPLSEEFCGSGKGCFDQYWSAGCAVTKEWARWFQDSNIELISKDKERFLKEACEVL